MRPKRPTYCREFVRGAPRPIAYWSSGAARRPMPSPWQTRSFGAWHRSERLHAGPGPRTDRARIARDSLRIRVATGDVRSVRTGEKYDAVMSLFHVVSYLNSDRDLALAFETAAEHLHPGGLFLFDFWYGPAVLSQKPEIRVKRLSDHDCAITRIAEPELRSDEDIVDVNYSLFIEDKASAVISRLQETHSMRYLFLPELQALAGHWFEPLDTHAWLSDEPPDTTTWSAVATMVRR